MKKMFALAGLSMGITLATAGCSAEDPGDGDGFESPESGESADENVAETEQALTATYRCTLAKKCDAKTGIYVCSSLHVACGPSFKTGCIPYKGSTYYMYWC